jgi:hypothetical protein
MNRTTLKAPGKNPAGSVDELHGMLVAGIEACKGGYWRGASARSVMWHAAQRGRLDLARRAADAHRTFYSGWDMQRATTWALLAALEAQASMPESSATLLEARAGFAEGLAFTESHASEGELDEPQHRKFVWEFDVFVALAEHHRGDPVPLAHAAERLNAFLDTDVADSASVFLATVQVHLGETRAAARTVRESTLSQLDDALFMAAYAGDASGIAGLVKATGDGISVGVGHQGSYATSILRIRHPEAFRTLVGALIDGGSMGHLLRDTRMAMPELGMTVAAEWLAASVGSRRDHALCEAVFAGEAEAVGSEGTMEAATAIALGRWPLAASLLDEMRPRKRAKPLLFALTGPLDAASVEPAAAYLQRAELSAPSGALADLCVAVQGGQLAAIKVSLKTAMEACKTVSGYERVEAYAALASALVALKRGQDAYKAFKKLTPPNRSANPEIALGIAKCYLAEGDLGGSLAALSAVPEDQLARFKGAVGFWLSHDLEAAA